MLVFSALACSTKIPPGLEWQQELLLFNLCSSWLPCEYSSYDFRVSSTIQMQLEIISECLDVKGSQTVILLDKHRGDSQQLPIIQHQMQWNVRDCRGCLRTQEQIQLQCLCLLILLVS